MKWFDKLISHTALVKAKNNQLQQYDAQIVYFRNLVTDLIDDDEIVEGIDYASIAKRKAELCSSFFTQLKEEQQKNEKLENEIFSLKHMLDRYEEELEKLRKE